MKKILSFVLSLALIFIGGVCLVACGGGKGVNLHNKTYKISNQGTYAFYQSSDNGTMQTCANPVQYLTENWDAIVSADQAFGKQTPEELLQYMKSLCLDDEYSRSLKGAVIVVGKATKESESVHKSDFECKLNNQTIFQTQIRTDTFNKDRKQASLYNTEDGMAYAFDFELTDFDSKNGSINNIKVGFAIKNEDITIHYSNHMKFGILFGEDKAFTVSLEYDLQDYANNE